MATIKVSKRIFDELLQCDQCDKKKYSCKSICYGSNGTLSMVMCDECDAIDYTTVVCEDDEEESRKERCENCDKECDETAERLRKEDTCLLFCGDCAAWFRDDGYTTADEKAVDDDDGEDAKCWYCNCTGVDTKTKEGVWIHADCE